MREGQLRGRGPPHHSSKGLEGASGADESVRCLSWAGCHGYTELHICPVYAASWLATVKSPFTF